MNTIQNDLADDALVTDIRANLNDFFHHLSRSLPEGRFEDKKFTRWHSGVQHPWFNGMLSSDLPQGNEEAFIENTIQYFRSKKVGVFTWWLEHHLNPSTWQPLLSKHGFGFSDDTPGMAADLQALNESVQTLDRLEVSIVEDKESLRTWAHIFTQGYGLPPSWETSVYDLWLKLGLGFPMCNFLGTLNGEPIATSCLFLGAGVAGIYNVSTLPKARGKGIGAAMTLRPLQEARETGYRIGVLQSSEMGYHVYQQLGFRHLCQIEHFYLVLQ